MHFTQSAVFIRHLLSTKYDKQGHEKSRHRPSLRFQRTAGSPARRLRVAHEKFWWSELQCCGRGVCISKIFRKQDWQNVVIDWIGVGEAWEERQGSLQTPKCWPAFSFLSRFDSLVTLWVSLFPYVRLSVWPVVSSVIPCGRWTMTGKIQWVIGLVAEAVCYRKAIIKNYAKQLFLSDEVC